MDFRRITVVVAKRDAPSYRLRLESLTPFAQEAGLQLETVILPRRPEWLRLWRLARLFRSSKGLIFSKTKLLLGEDALVRRWCPKWVFDVDDAVMYGKPKRHGDPPDQAWWRQRRFARMVRASVVTVVASKSLKRMTEIFGGRVLVWPTPVDLRRYPLVPREPERELRLCWIGLGANLRYLEDLAAALRALAARVPFRLRVISDRLPELPGVPMELEPWDGEREGEQLARCHVGLAPLPDDLWTRGKGGYRCIQYAAAGIPCVASPIGANAEVVVSGVTGLFASKPQEWVEGLARLLQDHDLRSRLGMQARRRAETNYDLSMLAPRYVNWLRAVVDGFSVDSVAPGEIEDEESGAAVGKPFHHQVISREQL